MASKQVLNVHVLSCGAMSDLMSDQEALFLRTSLGLFRNVVEHGRATPRANVSLTHAYTKTDFLANLRLPADLLHLVTHAGGDRIQTGNGKFVEAAALADAGRKGKVVVPPVVVSTGCELFTDNWSDTFAACGARLFIASPKPTTPANLAAFDMAFYSALLSSTQRGTATVDRVKAAFGVANGYYESLWPVGTPHAPFKMAEL